LENQFFENQFWENQIRAVIYRLMQNNDLKLQELIIGAEEGLYPKKFTLAPHSAEPLACPVLEYRLLIFCAVHREGPFPA